MKFSVWVILADLVIGVLATVFFGWQGLVCLVLGMIWMEVLVLLERK